MAKNRLTCLRNPAYLDGLMGSPDRAFVPAGKDMEWVIRLGTPPLISSAISLKTIRITWSTTGPRRVTVPASEIV